MFKTLQPLILASESPRRKRLLLDAGVVFLVDPSRMEESLEPDGSSVPGKSPAETAERCAYLKANSISTLHPDSWIFGADTIVVLNGRIFGKPSGRADAVGMLQALSGRVHDVITGMCLIQPRGKLRRSGSVTTRVHFKDLSMREIEAYVRTGEPLDKAGAYGIQGIGAFLVRSVEGSYTNVVGLPLCQTLEWLMNENIIEPE
ncbi:MAG: nucleoside triphosphate pyrophosphatase [Syntrophobacteraceae bacterium]|jgi:septum formation protein